MNEFKREERYIVVKLKHLAGLQVAPLRNFLRENRVPTLDCVVVESDWPEYDKVWQSIERRMTGQPAVTAAEELDAALHWRGKHTQAIRERDALQQLLNQRDEQVESLKLQPQGEPVSALKKARDVLRSIIRDKAAGVHYASAQAACHQINQALEQSAPVAMGLPKYECLCCLGESMSGCEECIPDFSRGNGNKARRRAESLGLTIPAAPTAYDGFDNGVD